MRNKFFCNCVLFVIIQEFFLSKGLCLDPLKEFNLLYENILALINRDPALFASGLLFVWNLSDRVTEANLRDKFIDCGQILAIRLFPDVIRSSRQCALVSFVSCLDGIRVHVFLELYTFAILVIRVLIYTVHSGSRKLK